MLVPLSWLKDFVDIKLPLKKLCLKLTEAGLSVEKVIKEKDDTILELEITPNRPDCLSIIGIAREAAVIEKTKIKNLNSKIIDQKIKKPLKIKIINDFNLCPRYTGIIIENITIKSSPLFIQERLKKIGLRPINNLVDFSNYVMFELGNPIHCFDYDAILDKTMCLQQSLGGEEFTSVDNLSYKLPKNAIIIKDKERVIDLCGIKGGLNTGISEKTKTVFIHVPVYNPVLVRRAGQALGLRSEASAIFERGVNKDGTIEALSLITYLIKKYANGAIASQIIDLKKDNFNPWKIKLSQKRLSQVLGIEIPLKEILIILRLLNFTVKKKDKDILTVSVPTYRNDLKIEEDLIEEIARHYGYNRFPKTLPKGQTPIQTIAYTKNIHFEEKIKNLMTASGFSEIYTYSLISKNQIEKLDPCLINSTIEIVNPVSLDFQYLRPTLLLNLLEAIKLNQPNYNQIRLFELGKIYLTEKDQFEEKLYLTAISANDDFYSLKSVCQKLLTETRIDQASYLPLTGSKIWHPYRSALVTINRETIGTIGEIHPDINEKFLIKNRLNAFNINLSLLKKLMGNIKPFKPLSLYPAVIQDLTFIFPEKVLVGDVINEISCLSKLVSKIEYLGVFKDAFTFRLYYQSPEKNLSENEVKEIREKIISNLNEKFKLKLK